MQSFTTLLKLAILATTALAAPVAESDGWPSGWGPIVSTTWLAEHVADPGLTVIDVRSEAEFNAAHIPGSVNIPWRGVWAQTSVRDGGNIDTEFPPVAEIQAVLAQAGISWPSANTSHPTRVVVAGPTVRGPRAATTVRYAGLPAENLAILNGAFEAWAAAKAPVTTEKTIVTPGTFTAVGDEALIAHMEDVEAFIGRKSEGLYLVDGRSTDMYTGASDDAIAGGQRGHIASAVSIPTPDAWTPASGFRPRQELMALAGKALSAGAKPTDIIVYCHTGQQAATWFYLLSNVFGYVNVRLYDGSTQEWAKFHELVLD